MGSYSELYVSGHPVSSNKSSVYPADASLFASADKKVYERRVSDRNPLVWGHLDSDEYETAFEYRTSAKKVAERLDVMGFTLRACEEMFEAMREMQLSNEYIFSEERATFLRRFRFADWLGALRTVIEQRPFKSYEEEEVRARIHEPVHYVLGGAWPSDDLFGFPLANKVDMRCVLRGLLEAVDHGAEVVLDYTELVHGGYYEEGDDPREMALELPEANYPSNEQIILLTEGSSDRCVLENTLEVRYPHLCDLYSFFDFHASNAPGGAKELVRAIKAFAGCGVRNRIVAIFDNDTAAAVARRALYGTRLPPNVKVIELPSLEMAENYPTIGPQGTYRADVNGSACSIELYLGADVLKDENGKLTPVQWKGYDQTLRQYQGEVLNKESLVTKYLDLLSRVRRDPRAAEKHDWWPMELVFDSIFSAFNG
jgi:hypothetical protein